MFIVYIVQSLKDKGYYIGCTSNLEFRLLEHNRGNTKSLKNRLPVELVYIEEYKTKAEALLRERKIKAYKGGEAFKRLINKGAVPEWSNG